MMYDATTLTAEGEISGFVNNESAPFETTGQQINAGQSKNTYAIYWNDETATAQQSNTITLIWIWVMEIMNYVTDVKILKIA